MAMSVATTRMYAVAKDLKGAGIGSLHTLMDRYGRVLGFQFQRSDSGEEGEVLFRCVVERAKRAGKWAEWKK